MINQKIKEFLSENEDSVVVPGFGSVKKSQVKEQIFSGLREASKKAHEGNFKAAYHILYRTSLKSFFDIQIKLDQEGK